MWVLGGLGFFLAMAGGRVGCGGKEKAFFFGGRGGNRIMFW